MNIIIVGAGEVGRYLAERLSVQSVHNICVIEKSESRCAVLSEKLDVRVMTADGTSVMVLEEANIARCDLFLAVSSDQSTNLVAASLAKSLGASTTIARVHASMLQEEWLFDFKKQFNINHIFSSERLVAVELAKFIRSPDALFVQELAKGQIELQQLIVSSSSPYVGKALAEIALPPHILIGMVKRARRVHIPDGSFTIQEDDLITLLGPPNKLKSLRNKFQTDVKDSNGASSVVIFGGNEYGATLASISQAAGIDTRIFEPDEKLCSALSHSLPEVTILNGDATQLEPLREECVGKADFFVAVTPNDEDNVMACLQARNLGTPHCLVLIHRGDYAQIIQDSRASLGLTGAVSPREATCQDLMRFVTEDQYHLVRKLDGGVELIEVIVREKSQIAGKTVSEVRFPSGLILVAQLRAQRAQVPAASDVIEVGDTIYAIVSQTAKKPFFKLLDG